MFLSLYRTENMLPWKRDIKLEDSIDTLGHARREDLPISYLEIVSIKISPLNCRAFNLLASYGPPGDPVETLSCLERCFSFMDQEDVETRLICDENCDLTVDNNLYDKSVSNLNEIYSTYGFQQLINDPTRVTLSTSSLIDHIATNHPMNIALAGVHKICLSDHYMVFCARKF